MYSEITKISELIIELRTGDVMKKDLITVTPSTPMKNLRGILKDNHISGTPVVEGEDLVGIISIEDFIKWLRNGETDVSIEERMTRDVVTIYEDEMLIQALTKLNKYGFGRLPVISRETGKLKGLITKGNILEGLLIKLDIDYRHVENKQPVSSSFFENIVADKSALILEYIINDKEMSHAGSTAVELKTTLKKLGISPKIARCVAIAAYEAEMNIIFFAKNGKIKASIGADSICITVNDHGPGIPDIEKAKRILGFETKTSLNEALDEIIPWIKKQIEIGGI